MIRSPYFERMPSRGALVQAIESPGFPAPALIELFEYSSCSPTFLVTWHNGSKIVLRAPPQNSYFGVSRSVCGIQKEIYCFKFLKSLGLMVPDVLAGGNIVEADNLPIFAMSHVPGIAIERYIRELDSVGRAKWLDKIARILALLHAQKLDTYGLIGNNGLLEERYDSLADFIAMLFDVKINSLREANQLETLDEVKRFISREAPRVCVALTGRSPSFVLYDTLAGNMLADGQNIWLIDLVTAGYFEPLMEFCAIVYSLEKILLEPAGDTLGFDYFLRCYTAYGGELPDREALLPVIRFFVVNDLLSAFDYFRRHRAAEKQTKAPALLSTARRIMRLTDLSLKTLISELQ